MPKNKGKIVIIEDEKILIDVLQKKLENEDYEVETAEDGIKGLELIYRVKPDLVLLDILMPKMNGYEVLTELHNKFGKDGMPPVIIISNSGQPVEIDRAKGLGAKDFIIKAEFTPKEVLGKVNKLMGHPVDISPSIKEDPIMDDTTEQEKSSSTSDKKLLIVEDDQFLRDLLKIKFEKEGFIVVTAIDGPGGFEKVIIEKPKIILLDIILPGIDGFEVLKRVRTNSDIEIAKTPIILLSNLGQESDVERGRALGADDYLIKSNFTIDEIIEKVREVLSGK